MNGYLHRCGKILGGIRNVILTGRTNIGELIFDPENDTYTSISFHDPDRVVLCTFPEGGVLYQENVRTGDGVVSVQHSLEIQINRMEAEERQWVSRIVDASLCGLVAILTMRNGNRILVGYSEESKDERPLRATSTRASSGSAPVDACGETVLLESVDNAKARFLEVTL